MPGSADLRWVDAGEPGLERVVRGRGFAYRDAARREVRKRATLERIRKLAIPPAWRDVWICADAHGHIQATGRDARGRKQYRYHAQWQALRGRDKFDHLLAFARVLPRIRARVKAVLEPATSPSSPASTPSREQVLAALVRLLDTTWLRVGNDEYARHNATYGLSTLRDRHAAVRGATLRLSFVGKGGKRHEASVEDRRVARVVRRCQDVPGQALFQYIDDEGQPRRVGSTDVNAWLAQASTGSTGSTGSTRAAAAGITAKDFRTWHGSVQALALTLAGCGAQAAARVPARGAPAQGSNAAAPVTPQLVLKEVARRLGNTPAVCRKAYIHPGVMALGEQMADEGSRAALRVEPWVTRPPARRGLGLHERQLVGLLHAERARRGRSNRRSA